MEVLARRGALESAGRAVSRRSSAMAPHAAAGTLQTSRPAASAAGSSSQLAKPLVLCSAAAGGVASTSGTTVDGACGAAWSLARGHRSVRGRAAARGGVVAAAAGAPAETSGAAGKALGPEDPQIVSPKKEAQLTLEQYKEIYDRLIKIFQTRPRDDWKKLIVFSKQWDAHQQGVFDRIKELSDAEADVDKKMALRKLFRALQNVAEEVARYNRVLGKLAEAGDDEWEAIVAAYRGDLQKPFFEHVQCLMAAAKEDPSRLETLVLLNTRLVALIANHDAVAADQDKLDQAAELYRDLLTSISSIEDLDKRMADLATSGRIDPAFLQISAKAYGAARDTNMTKDEAKWVAYKMYRNARDYFDRQQPAEKRIIEYLLTIPDPTERRNMLDKAVTPGPIRATETHDYLYSTPQRLFLVLDNTLRAYTLMKDGATQNLGAAEAAVLPKKVRVMMELRDDLVRRYL